MPDGKGIDRIRARPGSRGFIIAMRRLSRMNYLPVRGGRLHQPESLRTPAGFTNHSIGILCRDCHEVHAARRARPFHHHTKWTFMNGLRVIRRVVYCACHCRLAYGVCCLSLGAVPLEMKLRVTAVAFHHLSVLALWVASWLIVVASHVGLRHVPWSTSLELPEASCRSSCKLAPRVFGLAVLEIGLIQLVMYR